MAWKNQQQFIDALEKAGELIRIKSLVDPKLEIAEITDRISKSGNGGKSGLPQQEPTMPQMNVDENGIIQPYGLSTDHVNT